MVISRREFLAGVGGAGIAYAFHVSCTSPAEQSLPSTEAQEPPLRTPDDPGVDYRLWLVVGADGIVTAYTCRVEIGQGLKTLLYNVICQGLDLPEDRVRTVLGDTDLCPADGPTTGSAATQYVVWGFWKACHWIRNDLMRRAAERLSVEVEELEYRGGTIVSRNDPRRSLGIGELVDGSRRLRGVDLGPMPQPGFPYLDRGTLNVNGEAIVTGTLDYAGDVYPEGCLYGGRVRPPYHTTLTDLEWLDMQPALEVPGVVGVHAGEGSGLVFARTYSALRKGLERAETTWLEPKRPRKLDNENEIRRGARQKAVVEEHGDVEAGFGSADTVIDETYITQYASQASIETHTAVAEVSDEQTTIWTGTQNPLLMRFRTARNWEVPEDSIRVIGTPVGGAFGSKTGHRVATEAANMARRAQAPVKYIYSRDEQFNDRSRYKDSVIVDIASGVTEDGRLIARRIDIYQDEGYGSEDTYEVPHVRTRLYQSRLPVRHAVMRGTSYVQVCFAVESHTDMVARAAGMDPLEFRKKNVAHASFRPLLDACAGMIGWGEAGRGAGRGVGIGLCHHGGKQLGVVAAEVTVDRGTGGIRVERLCGAFDIGLVINRNTLTMGVKGAMLWGLGYALHEEVRLDGHRSHTSSFSDYRIARFSDTPPIEVVFLDNEAPGAPRGCGELPVIPTIGAICNAVHDATGVRFYELPMTPERVRTALVPA